jgi:PAS domain S-box-containing protein
VVVDTQGRIVRFNQACEQVSGYRFEEVAGKVCWDLFLVPEELEMVQGIFAKLVAGEFPTYCENYWRTRDNGRRRIMWSNTVLLDENKRVQYVIATGVDVTQAHTAESRLRVLTRAMEAGPSSVVITDAQGTITYVNPAFARLTGYAPEEVIQKTPRLWKSGKHPAEFYAALWQTLVQGREWRGEFCNKKKNGELFWVYSTISPIKDEGGKITHFVAVVVDITERKHYEQALEQSRQELEHKVAERTSDLETTVQNLLQEVDARRRVENEIQHLLQCERLVTEISTDFTHLEAGCFETRVREGIRRLMVFLKAERASLSEFVGQNICATVSCHEDGIPPTPPRIPGTELPWSRAQLRVGKRIVFSKIDDLPGEAAWDRETYRKLGTQALIALPLVVSGKTIGALVFVNASGARNWPAETVQRLRLVEDLFAGVLMQWRSEKALTGAERRYHAVADFMQDWEYWESPEGALLFCSPACERITGCPPQQFLADPKLLHKIVLQEDARLWAEFHREAFAQPQERSLQFRIRRPDGAIRWIEHHSRPVTDEKGTFLGLRASNRDHTDVKQAELESQRLHEELARVARMTMADHLAASLAHELRQPLAAILSNAEAAQQFLESQPPEHQEVREALQDIVQNDDRASQIIRRLRGFYRRASQERAPLDLNKLIDETLSLLRSELILCQVSWQHNASSPLPLVFGDRVEIQQVLMNLILNARDAMLSSPPDTRYLVVGTALQRPNHARVSVSDSGTGIDPATAEHMFEPFFTTKESGMGMGLPICRSIIEAHDGRLWAANHPNRGAIFHFTIPVCKVSNP